ncbi:unnamed protein product [Spirodela intermedia]|uniref:NAD-dependent epimerase/dehydratase domain-containing protein n=2 Tax=Spirodela intermedia TaxID=51605 RepID=A0A7I8KJP7_SPIIN|nr:unnamed protein product [Spirodela intermedia]CAA6661617.1 unnamed protein product [Spirodela intermedia]CAA7397993.1 unnamed protein product [Spirodela intermedia]
MAEERRVCVTGAGGFVASWLVKLLLSKGFVVHGTVRDPIDPKNVHLKRLENAANLKLFKADLLDYESLSAAIAGCEGVFHAACPVPLGNILDPEADMVRPAVDGTLNVLKACSEANVRRLVLVSSVSAVLWNPNWPFDKIVDENCWSDKKFCRETEMWYEFAKTVAEEKALEYSKSSGLDVVVVCPPVIFGPILQPTVNTSSKCLINFLKGKRVSVLTYHILYLVDVRDVADALLLVYEKPEASGRYICSSYCIETCDFLGKLKSMYPHFPYPDCPYEAKPYHQLSSEKLKQLGWTYMTIEESIRDNVEDFLEKSLLDVN